MKDLMRYLGIIIILIAIVILATPHFIGVTISSNTLLMSVLALLVIGLITHIIVNKK